MALQDLLWACPLCHRVEAIDRTGKCGGCGARFRRAAGATIAATAGAGAAATIDAPREAVAWLAMLPWGDLDGEGLGLPGGVEPPFEQRAEVRTAGTELPLRRAGRFLGAVERFGPAVQGTLRLDLQRVRFDPLRAHSGSAGKGEPPPSWEWPLTQLTAIQPASSAIQLKARTAPVVSLRFPDGSIRLWEQRLKYCTRAAWQASGKGEISEFQPWIRSR